MSAPIRSSSGAARVGWCVIVLWCLAAVIVPWSAMLAAVVDALAWSGGIRDAGEVETTFGVSGPWAMLARSMGIAAGVGVVAALLAWPASRLLRMRAGGVAASCAEGLALAATVGCTLVPIALPPWLLYASLWMSTGPGTWIGDLAERNDLVGVQRFTLLALALIAWALAPAIAVLTAVGSRALGRDADLARIDRSPWHARLRAAFARDAGALAVAALACSAFLLGETTVFDLAQMPTAAFELRTLDALGAAPAEVFRASLPIVSCIAAIIAVALMVLARSERLRGRARSAATRIVRERAATPSVRSLRLLWPVLVTAAPAFCIGLLLLRVAWSVPRKGDFLIEHGAALVTSVGVGLSACLLVGLLAVALGTVIVASGAHVSRWARRAPRIAAALLLVVGFLPGTLTALAMSAAYNRPLLAFVYDSPMIVVLALAMRAAPVAVLVAWAMHASVPDSARSLGALDGTSLTAILRTQRALLGRIAIASTLLALPWCLGELTTSARVVPPGIPWLASDVLNAVHYQRPETVILAVLGLFALAVPAVLVALGAIGRGDGASRWSAAGRSGACAMLAVAASVAVTACAPSDATGGGEARIPDDPSTAVLRASAPAVELPLRVDAALQGVGRGKGQFNAPRVLAIDPRSASTYVIDKDARIQRFDASGAVLAEWRMPKSDRGKPVGATVAPDGTLVVADTHEHRLVAFSPDGVERWTLGTYGTEPGQFIYPTDIVFLPDGRMLVAEYGGNDRIQAFDRDHRFMYQFGHCDTADGAFLRPQALQYDPARDELFVADAGNHRIGVFTSDGEWRRSLGSVGSGAGEFRYPFGLVLLIDGRAIDEVPLDAQGALSAEGERTLVVAEQSNHRIQWIDADTGQSRAVVGGLGRERGRLKYPWALAAAGRAPGGAQRFAVCEQGNSRIAYFTLPPTGTPGSHGTREAR